ncbi:MAG: hypothetical protein ACO3JL_09135, partial [Myxococcota bacterium]
HVAGVAMLAKALNPLVSQGAFQDLLEDTADGDVSCPAGCGAGLINAARVLRGLEGAEAVPLVVLSPAVTRIGRGDRDAELTLENLGDVTTDVSLSVGGPQRAQVTLSLVEARLAPDERLSVHVDIARDETDSGEVTISVAFEGKVIDAKLVWNADVVRVARSVLVAALRIEGEGFTVAKETTATELDEYRYRLSNLEPGRYLILGLSDDDNDGEYEDFEGVGGYPRIEQVAEIELASGARVTDIDFLVAPAFVYEDDDGQGIGGIGAGCSASNDCDGELYCEQLFDGGYCTRDCSLGAASCPAGSACFCLGDDGASGCAYRICLQECVSDGECRVSEGYVCDVDSTCYPT